MEMNNQACACPGLKLGHNKKPASPTTPSTTPTEGDAGTAKATEKKRTSAANQAAQSNNKIHRTRSKFKLTGHEPIKLDRLPASPQTLFKKEQLLSMLDEFARHMYDAITTNGIQVPPSIKIGLNSMGDIRVLGNHPDQGKIENLFSNNSSLALQLHQIAFTSRAQQLADLQPGFTNDFFKIPTDIQQITFVHLRAVKLSPFSMTIDQAGDSAKPTMEQQGQTTSLSLIHMVISRSKEISATPPDNSNQAVTTPMQDINTKDDPKPVTPVLTEPRNKAVHELINDAKAKPIEKDPKITLDDPVIPRAEQEEVHKKEKHHHVHKGKMRCVINR